MKYCWLCIKWLLPFGQVKKGKVMMAPLPTSFLPSRLWLAYGGVAECHMQVEKALNQGSCFMLNIMTPILSCLLIYGVLAIKWLWPFGYVVLSKTKRKKKEKELQEREKKGERASREKK
jgi:hypothetical protein